MIKQYLKTKFPAMWSTCKRIRLLFFRFVVAKKHQNIIYYKDLDMIFLSVAKNGSSTINSMLLKKLGIELNEHQYGTVHEAKDKFRINTKTYEKLDTENIFVFSFVRNPLNRLISCYKNKIILERNHQLIREYPPGFFYNDMPFDLFVERVCLLPDCWSNKHFQSQYSYIYPDGIKKVDFIGKLENFDQDIKTITTLLDIDNYKTLNKTSNKVDLNEYYTKDLAKKVYKRYQKDFENFGYIDDFENICKHLN